MSRFSIVFAVAVLFAYLPATAQVAVSAAAQSGQNSQADLPQIDVSYILAEFSQSLNARKLKLGDQVTAQVTQDALSHGRIVIPADSRLVGHLVEVKQSEKDDPESRLGIVFDKVMLKHHREVSLYGMIQALAPPTLRRSNVDEPDLMIPPSLLISQGTPAGSRSSMGSRGNSSIFADPVPVTAVPPGLPLSPSSGAAHDGKPSASGNPSLSIGTPLGVLGIKGLTLKPKPGSTGGAPVPVIFSKTGNVKLENGVQVLVKITETPRNP